MYSIDTGHFYSNREKYLHDMNGKYRRERSYLSNKRNEIKIQVAEFHINAEALDKIQLNEYDHKFIQSLGAEQLFHDYFKISQLIKHKKAKANDAKEKLKKIIKNKVDYNVEHPAKVNTRILRSGELNDTNIISVFDSSLTRAMGIEKDTLTEDFMVVQIYYFDIFKDIMHFGFLHNKEKYRYLTSSAGQIRKKKAVFIKESVWSQIEKNIMCGLTISKINDRGGNNVNKHLAYLALTNSATDEWTDFDIDRTIIIDDFETKVGGMFDFIDETDYSISRKNGEVPICHTDGIGMMLPSLSRKNFMVRAPWIKGLLGVFDFHKFILATDSSPVIQDIYGKTYDIFKDNIQIIFTKSQFKMYQYYDSWEEYKQFFKEYQCSAGKCNIEEDRIKNAKLNYQVLQTLTNITEEEIVLITQKSIDKINNLCSSPESMKEALGITPYVKTLTPFQKSVKIYPALLQDTYSKDIIREIKDSLLKKYRSGKLEVLGKYTFIMPDLYAACEYWFQKIENPRGLLADGEIFCWLFRNSEKVDCLRSPHLYREHAIKFNTAHKIYESRDKSFRDWFITDALYTSSHDLISKVLQFDVDGDKSLVIADPVFVKVAERNMNDVCPLYYNMYKAQPQVLNSQTIYSGLNAAFTGAPIGVDSNNISKIWNSNVFINGTDTDKEDAIQCIKLLCMENNFHIDYAKTLYKPVRPREIDHQISKYTNCKLPAFFQYAKDKETCQTDERNDSFVNKLLQKFPNKSINTRGVSFDKLDYRYMMHNDQMKCRKEVQELYDVLNKQYRYMINMKDEHIDNLRYVACKIRSMFHELGYTNETVTDMIIDYLYGHNKRSKQLLWFCYGQYILENLEENLTIKKTKYVECEDCNEWIEIDFHSKSTRCKSCQQVHKKERNRAWMRKNRNVVLS